MLSYRFPRLHIYRARKFDSSISSKSLPPGYHVSPSARSDNKGPPRYPGIRPVQRVNLQARLRDNVVAPGAPGLEVPLRGSSSLIASRSNLPRFGEPTNRLRPSVWWAGSANPLVNCVCICACSVFAGERERERERK